MRSIRKIWYRETTKGKEKAMATHTRVLMIMVFVIGVAGCGGGDALPDNERLLNAFQQGRTGVWVSGHGTVAQLIGDVTIAGEAHQRVVVNVDDSLDLIVRHSVEASERVPFAQGDPVAFQGRYEWNGRGGVLGYTHHDPEQPGEGGWIRHDGTTYD
ncbi:DUF3465 domain-containing protein [Wenzhouxiangella sediminis]|uniref:DUF3465 domain-containing protein n=2 Tax=Wenzhouxiangella sediminis TaxID=1792836 RepID=A0A3E1K749_9GAMM|nr:DUF3465 domain-containing protein [Wenzhouxiangella sediminis]